LPSGEAASGGFADADTGDFARLGLITINHPFVFMGGASKRLIYGNLREWGIKGVTR
jgi:hypothetical protein